MREVPQSSDGLLRTGDDYRPNGAAGGHKLLEERRAPHEIPIDAPSSFRARIVSDAAAFSDRSDADLTEPNTESPMRKSSLIALSAILLAGTALADAAAPRFVSLQPSDLLASNVIGLDIQDTAGHDIGKIQDVAFDGSKAVKGYVLSVGGFLGMGTHYVVVDTGAVKIDYDTAAKKWHANMDATADQLKAAPPFEYEGRWNGSKS